MSVVPDCLWTLGHTMSAVRGLSVELIADKCWITPGSDRMKRLAVSKEKHSYTLIDAVTSLLVVAYPTHYSILTVFVGR